MDGTQEDKCNVPATRSSRRREAQEKGKAIEREEEMINVLKSQEEPNENQVKQEELDDKVSSCHTEHMVTVKEGSPEQDQTAQNKEKGVSLKTKRETKVAVTTTIPRGKPKSGRVWKENKKRFSDMVKDRPLRTSWEVKMKERQEKKLVKSFTQQLKEERQRAKEEKRKRREENLRRRLENERKAEIVQVIRNTAKLKRASKKQLRTIEKRDTLMMSQAGKKLSQKKTAPSKAAAKNNSATS